MLERMIYVSLAAPGIGSGEVYGIIREAHARNAAAGISGALIFMHGRFAQVLEGSAPALRAVWGAILRDPRHADVALRARERALCRLFPGQAMALRTRACLDPGLLEAFGYRPGFPVETFPADVLLEFLVRACRSAPRSAHAQARRAAPDLRR
jgi:Sensors of blue-light using FAD